MSVKFLIVLCLGVLVAQGNAQRPDPGEDFEYVLNLLEDLERQITDEVHNNIDTLRADLKSIQDLTSGILNDLSTEFTSAIAPMLEQISALEERARELGIDISDCVGDSLNEIADVPKELLGVTAECLNVFYLDAEKTINEAIAEINNTVVAIDNYWTKIEQCAEREGTLREICIEELESEISRDSVDIPDEIALFVEEALGYLNTVKEELLVCTSGKLNYLLEIGNAIVANVTACALNKIDTTTTIAPTTERPTTVSPTTAAPTTTTEVPTTERPTTAAPTTAAPTTTTELPTTEVPTTERPTTASPTTAAPTTTTEVPTTERPTTAAPTTAAPTTSTVVPTTEVPTTETTAAPITTVTTEVTTASN